MCSASQEYAAHDDAQGDTTCGRVAGRPGGAQAGRMSGPREDDETPNNLRPGQYDEGGHGGMATRELEAKEKAGKQAGKQAGESAESAG